MGLVRLPSFLSVSSQWNSHRHGERACLIQEKSGYLPVCDVPRHDFLHEEKSYASALGLASSQVNGYGTQIDEDYVVAVGTTFQLPAVTLLHFPHKDNFTRSWNQIDYNLGQPALKLGASNDGFVLVLKSIAQVADDGDGVWTSRDQVVKEYDLARARFGNATLPTEKIRGDVQTLDGVFHMSWQLVNIEDPVNVVVGVTLTLRNFTLVPHSSKTSFGLRAYLAHRDVKLHVDPDRRVAESHSREAMYWAWQKKSRGSNHWYALSHSVCYGKEAFPLRWIEDNQVRAIAKASNAERVTEMTFLFHGEAPPSGVIDKFTWSSSLTWFQNDPESRGPIGISAMILVVLIVVMSFGGAYARRSSRSRPAMARALIAPP
jgi:hypothetical protein